MLNNQIIMPKAKVNKERKLKVENFKTKQKEKMDTQEMPQFKPFRQVPVWEDNAQFTITGAQFRELQEFFNMFVGPIQVVEDLFRANLNAGKIEIKYLDNENTEIAKEDIQAYMKKFQEYVVSQKDRSKDVVATIEAANVESEDEAQPTKPILSVV